MLLGFVIIGMGQLRTKGYLQESSLQQARNVLNLAMLTDLLELKRIGVKFCADQNEFCVLVRPEEIADYPTPAHQYLHRKLLGQQQLYFNAVSFLRFLDDHFIEVMKRLLQEFFKHQVLVQASVQQQGKAIKVLKLQKGIRQCFPQAASYFQEIAVRAELELLDVSTYMVLRAAGLASAFGLDHGVMDAKIHNQPITKDFAPFLEHFQLSTGTQAQAA